MSLAPSATPFRTIRIRGPSAKCIACGPDSTITDDLDAVGYEAFCGMGGDDAQAESSSSVERIDVTALDEALKADSAGTRVILDVRTPVEFGICALPGSISESCGTPMSVGFPGVV
jgi:adenylyltransferase/sulfurtransferase